MLLQFPNNLARAGWIDVARALALFLVVVTHFKTIPEFHVWAYAVHIPLFFFISGVVFAKKEKKVSASIYAKKQLTTLIPIYIIAAFFLLTVQIFLSPFIPSQSLGPMVMHIFIGLPVGIGGVLWFLLALCWTRIFFAYLQTSIFTSRYILIISIILFIFGGYTQQLTGGFEFWSIQILPTTLAYYGLGYFYQTHVDAYLPQSIEWRLALHMVFLFVSMCAAIALFYIFGEYPNIGGNRIINVPLLGLASITGIGSIIFFGKVFEHAKVLRWIGERTLGIYLVHLTLVRSIEGFFPQLYEIDLSMRLSIIILLSTVMMVGIGQVQDFLYAKKRAV